ncbi:homoserine dehydrogenase [Anaerotignum lactatifermentans]|uniref:Homoserine dehydrogenase n=1 Tax=Anaerotignum lactatifermentans TaxID=160404 RepID=A0ABS2GB77_9FIRM|nr:homoserine dehydrogenase [Anaerotignum lactatifermentans]MBM6828451.1 homoserine dehydrogenase [Anaerotignum lactatifermentans]MBM6877858.1 homoserine dehydrogenase [Anaerotignum lactatifermentans]MBM6950034.1 homoserine dehydrogenase [Anaerotignum lactatifermentans]
MEDSVKKIALLGMGTVGSGVYEIIERQKVNMPDKIGCVLDIAKVLVRNKKKYENTVPAEKLTDQWSDIINDDSIDIVVEVMGGLEPARTYIKEALEKGKHVVTANKDLMATHGHELLDEAKIHGCDLLFEAAVAGGIPIIRPLKQCLVGNDISEVMGIINGTTNFILTKMTEEGMEFADALQLATDLGYAEADPTADIEGYDAGRKLAILASIAFHTPVTFDDVYTEGISKVTAKDIRYAHELGCEIKLLGIAKNTEDGIEVKVHPTMIPIDHPLASVKDSFNAVFVHGDAVGDTMFYGRGAGSLPTGSAVVGDIMDIARNMRFQCTGRIGCSCYKRIPIKEMKNTRSSYYIRMKLEDRAGTLAVLAGLFGSNNVSISKLLQKTKEGDMAEVVIVTHNVEERQFMDSITVIAAMSMVQEISSVIRVYSAE